MDDSRTPSSSRPEQSHSSSGSSALGDTARETPAYAAAAASALPPPDPSSPSPDDLGRTPTANPGHLTTPPSQARSSSAAQHASSPAPTSSPTPNPHRRTHSSTSSGPPSAPISAVSSPARREFTPGDLSDSVLHEESEEEEGYGHGRGGGTGGTDDHTAGDDLFNAAAALQRRPSSRIAAGPGGGSGLLVPGSARPRPPSAAQNQSQQGSYRRSISVNTSVSNSLAQQQQQQQQPRRSLYHPQSQAGLSTAPSHTSSSRARGADHGRRSVSRAGRQPTSATASEAEEDASDTGEWSGYGEVRGDRRTRAFSPAPVQKRDGDEDDEFHTRDRGEELVRKRMRERKDARRAARAAARQQQQQQQQRLSSYTSYSQTPAAELDHNPNALGLGYPAASGSSGGGTVHRARDPSVARSEAFSLFSDGGARSPTHAAGAPWSPLPLPPHAYGQQQASRPGLGGRGTSYVSNASANFPHYHAAGTRSQGGSTAPSVIEGSEAGETEGDEGLSTAEEENGDDEEDGVDGVEPRLEDWRDGGADGTHVGSDESDEGEDVEYTLKDRQDAINVEHPFGLPIWKPALYKKSRSIARHAESALHSAPSSTALHHLRPANLLWTLAFGIFFFVLCSISSAVLWVTPWGGAKYARVVWELGTYLFWPFGKYVEGWTDGGGADDGGDGQDGYAGLDEDDEDEESEEHHPVEGSYRHDPEAGGRTFGRGRSGTISNNASSFGTSAAGGGTTRTRTSVDSVFRPDEQALPDEPLRLSSRTVRATPSASSLRRISNAPNERSGLLEERRAHRGYGSSSTVTDRNPSGILASAHNDKSYRSSGSEETILGGDIRPHDFSKDASQPHHPFRLRALGRVMYWALFYGLVAPVMLLVCLACWFFVFTIPMAKLLWVLIRHLNNEPLSLHFRAPREYVHVEQDLSSMVDEEEGAQVDGPATGHADSSSGTIGVAGKSTAGSTIVYPLQAGQPAPPVSRKSLVADKRKGRLRGPHPTVLLCTYRAAGLEYYKYTIDGVNIWFVNLMSLVFFAIADFFFLEPYVAKHPESSAFLKLISGQGFVFVLSLLSVIPLSYFIGMAVASISAQSSIGMGAVINASFGSIIEVILYSIALTQAKGELVEGSIVGSILAGVLLMPGASMIAGAVRRKEQRFNAKSAGVTSTMLIMAVIGTLTPTMFYEIYGSFQLTCTDCDITGGVLGAAESCRTCYYEHVSPADDPFYKSTVRLLSYYCGIILVLSYLIGLWFSLRTHASQIWQNAAPEHGAARPLSGAHQPPPLHERRSLYQRIVPSQLFQPRRQPSNIGGASATGYTPLATPLLPPLTPHPAPPGSLPHATGNKHDSTAPYQLPHGMTADEFNRVYQFQLAAAQRPVPNLAARAPSHAREASAQQAAKKEVAEEDGHGGHDAPNWSRAKSATVLMACTVLYAIIAVVDVILDGSGLSEKLLGVTLFALVPNTTEFMNAISFALNGNIALSMEIGSAYALQVCLIQAPAMLAFSAWYGMGRDSKLHRAFTLVFPRWDVIAILFSIFLLTYVYIESRSNYQRGALLCLSYLVLIGGFAFAPGDRDTSDNPGFNGASLATLSSKILYHPATISFADKVKAIFLALFTR
ncbi:hypothetical protein JCM8547_008615 [Rhodosporidiobolus lusitaniae]